MDNENIVKKGTTTVGIVCKEGIVLAADKRATMGHFIANKKVEKVVPITDRMAVTTAGTVSDIQLFVKLIKAELKLKTLRTSEEVSVKEAANLLGSIMYQGIRRFSAIPAIVGFLLAGGDNDGLHLFELSPDGTVLEVDDYVADGSGMLFAYGTLDTLYKKGLSLKEGIDLGVKAVNAALQRDTNTGEGIDVYTITKEGIKKVLTKIVETNLIA